jgi:hypothetical protein
VSLHDFVIQHLKESIVPEPVKIHCALIDKDITLDVSGGGAMMALRMDPFEYQSGFKCSNEDECKAKSVSCLVFKDQGRTPFDDPDLLDVYNTIQNYRNHQLARIVAFSGMGVVYLKRKAQDTMASTSEERREMAYMIRFYTGPIAQIWPVLKQFLTPKRLLSEPEPAMEAYMSICYWIEKKKIPESARLDIIRTVVDMKKTLSSIKDQEEKLEIAEESINAVVDALYRG